MNHLLLGVIIGLTVVGIATTIIVVEMINPILEDTEVHKKNISRHIANSNSTDCNYLKFTEKMMSKTFTGKDLERQAQDKIKELDCVYMEQEN